MTSNGVGGATSGQAYRFNVAVAKTMGWSMQVAKPLTLGAVGGSRSPRSD